MIQKEGIEAVLGDLDDSLYPTGDLVKSIASFADSRTGESTNGSASSALQYLNDFFSALSQLALYCRIANAGHLPPFAGCSGREERFCVGIATVLQIGGNFPWIVEGGNKLVIPSTNEAFFNPRLSAEEIQLFQRMTSARIAELMVRYPDIDRYRGNEINVALELRKNSTITLEELARIVRKEFQDAIRDKFLEVTQSGNAVDLFPRDINKHTGLTHLCELTGIRPERTLAIGDSQGDIAILRMVGFAGCPANASEVCKALVQERGDRGYISPYPYAQGVIDIMTHFLKLDWATLALEANLV
ncbi:MAG: HAD hydrolase family protein [Candidatus Wildermuthbacteria bacterium]|nr:HAD hydrolase family protein [Candidatus Wildermuthbacteria bacterium]